jgi:hypothetical protein
MSIAVNVTMAGVAASEEMARLIKKTAWYDSRIEKV